jgi:2,5-furandicarboxylate decarboxylase 1
MSKAKILCLLLVLITCVGLAGSSSAKDMPAAKAKRLVDLKACIAFLEETGNLVRVKSEVDPEYELAGIAKRFEGEKCVLFENVKGSDYPVFMGLLWNRDIVGQLFGAPKEEVPFIINSATESWNKNKSALKEDIAKQGPANEVVMEEPNLYELPIPIHALKDGGPYFDASVVMAKNPKTGAANISIHRLMVTEKDRLTFQIDPGRHLGAYLQIMEAKNEPLEVTINVGVGFAPWINSAIPRQGDYKYRIAHHMVDRPIDLIEAQTVDVPAYAQAQFVIEAEILPNVREMEGPFAEVTGYYGDPKKNKVMRVKAITHQKNPIFHSLLSGQEVWNAVGFTAEAKIYGKVNKEIPQLQDVYLDPGGCGFYGAVVQIDKNKKDLGKEVIQKTFEAFRPLKRVIAVDKDVNLYDPIDVDWALTTRFNPDSDLIIMENQWGHVLHPLVKKGQEGKGGTMTKIGFDATAPYPRPDKFKRVKFRDVDLQDYKIKSE